MKCTKCGQQVDPADTFCGHCGAPAKAPTKVPAQAPGGGIFLERSPAADLPDPEQVEAFKQVAPPAAEPGPRPPMFRLAYDETVLKTYETVQLRTGLFKRKRGQGTLYVTNARVIFYAWVNSRGTQRASWLLQQTKLEDISGLSVHVSRRISLGLLFLSVAFGLATIATLILVPLAILFLILTVLCVIFLIRDARKRGSIGMNIHSRENGHSPIGFGNGGRVGFLDVIVRIFMWPVLIFFPSYSALDVAAGDPAEDAAQLVHELGALIIDLQTRGTMAYEHWGISTEPERVRSAGAL
jgi:zinc-ribbon domain